MNEWSIQIWRKKLFPISGLYQPPSPHWLHVISGCVHRHQVLQWEPWNLGGSLQTGATHFPVDQVSIRDSFCVNDLWCWLWGIRITFPEWIPKKGLDHEAPRPCQLRGAWEQRQNDGESKNFQQVTCLDIFKLGNTIANGTKHHDLNLILLLFWDSSWRLEIISKDHVDGHDTFRLWRELGSFENVSLVLSQIVHQLIHEDPRLGPGSLL